MLRFLLLATLLIHGASAKGHHEHPVGSRRWNTLSGDEPQVIANGGLSGLFPDSSEFAYQSAPQSSLPGLILFCDLQLTKDGAGLCKSELRLENSTNIAEAYAKRQSTYVVNGESMSGWFPLDFNLDELAKDKVLLLQNIYSRPNAFDGTSGLLLVEDVAGLFTPQARLWLNVQHDSFYKEHKLDATQYLSTIPKIAVDFISSPEVAFLKGLKPSPNTKLVFRFLAKDKVEPTTNSTYGDLLKDLNAIKLFASGILVPKDYIFPVGPKNYLDAPTTLVADAHKAQLEVYASGFANDAPLSYNYSYDPTAEILNFVDNGDFTVDGVLTDFANTASEAIACFAHNKNNTPPLKTNPLIITNNGASGIYPGSTDLSYQKAVEDGADVIDCNVQMSKDGVAFCLDSPDLTTSTTAMVTFMDKATTVPEIQQANGIFTFDLTWSDIQSLKPQMLSPFSKSGMERNPQAKNAGKLMSLPEFLDFAKNNTMLQGVLLNIENAPYLATKKGLGIVDTVSSALKNASYAQKVFIQSSDTAVLSKFTNFTRVLTVNETISAVPDDSVQEIKKFADTVNVRRASVMTVTDFFLEQTTKVVQELHKANVSVFVSVLRNEFTALAFDFMSDPVMEVATYVNGIGVNGLVTEFPGTAKAYLRSPCADTEAKQSYTILPTQPGALIQLVMPQALSPAQPPAPGLASSTIVDPPLPEVGVVADEKPAAAAPPPAKSDCVAHANVMNAVVVVVVAVVIGFVSVMA